MKKSILYILLVSAIVSSCSSEKKKNDLEFTNDLENLKGFSGIDNNVASVQKGTARSGEYISYTDSAKRFGYMFKAKLSDISDQQLKSVKAEVWVYQEQINMEAVLVITIDSLGKSIVWQGQKLNEFVKESKKWTAVTEEMDLSKLPQSKDYGISIYVWNTGNTPILSDDYRVRFDK